MNRNGFITLLVVLVLTALVQSVVIVRDTEKAILLKLGAFERTLEPGLNFKIPFIDTVTKFEARIRSLDTHLTECFQAKQNLLMLIHSLNIKL